MAWVRFTADFPFKPKPMVTILYRQGEERNIPREAADAAVKAKAAVRMKKGQRNGPLEPAP